MRWTWGLGVAFVGVFFLIGIFRYARSLAFPPPLPKTLVPTDLRAIGLFIRLGIGDKEPTNWRGEIRVEPGHLLQLWGWRFRAKDRIEGNRFFCRTRRFRRRVLSPIGVFAVLRAPEGATVFVRTKQGSFQFRLDQVPFGVRRVFLEGRVSVQRTPPVFPLTNGPTEEDFPAAVTDAQGNVWVTYVAYKHGGPPRLVRLEEPPKDFEFLLPKGNGDQIFLTRFDGTKWLSPMAVTEPGLDVWKPTVALDGKGRVWVIWAQQNIWGNWDLYARCYEPDTKTWLPVQRLTVERGSDIHAVAATDPAGRVWVAWQGWRSDNFDIFLALLTEKGFQDVRKISFSDANDWNPVITVDGQGTIYVAFDTYDGGNYDVWLVALRGGRIDRYPIATTPRFEARPSLAVDPQNRLWIAYEEGDVNWGKDYAGGHWTVRRFNLGSALYINRTVRVKCFVNGRLMTTDDDLTAKLAQKRTLPRSESFPRIGVDGKGRVWVLLRHATFNGPFENWMSYAFVYDGKAWSFPLPIAQSMNIMDVRPALAKTREGTLIAIYASDKRPTGTGSRQDSDLFVAVLSAPLVARPPALVAASSLSPEGVPIVHPDEQGDIRRIRSYRVRIGRRVYRLMRGEFHRHTELTSHVDQDGSLEDMWRYALDAAKLDWMGNGDHDNGYGSEYLWWLVQKTTDIYHHPPHFIPMFTYERSVRYPDGHRNVMFAQRGIRPLPRLAPQPGEPPKYPRPNGVSRDDTKMLYRYLKRFNGICAIHTGATNMGTDWRDNDPVAEPVVEIYQGLRQNYEHLGAPRSAPRPGASIGGWQPFGFAWNALAKGYRLGFQSSSDHTSTHISYAIVAVEEPTRRGILEGFKRRHCYAATDNIIMDVRCGDHWMGEEFTLKEAPTLHIKVIGTRPIAQIHIIKDFRYVYTAKPHKQEVVLTWMDNDARPGVSWYYVRVEQVDGQLAWSSPMWIHYQP